MIYSKLPVILLSYLSSDKRNSTNAIIASYILEHIEDIETIDIQSLSRSVHVANSSISRFVREIGLSHLNELKEMIKEYQSSFQRSNYYVDDVISSIRQASSSIDYHKIIQLCDDLHNYKKIAAFGLLKAQEAAFNMQLDLLMLSKHMYTTLRYSDQMDYITHADKDTLIILFTYTGSYFEYHDLRHQIKSLYSPKIYFISSSKQCPSYIDEHIYFSSSKDQIAHPYQLMIIEGLIMQEFAKKYY